MSDLISNAVILGHSPHTDRVANTHMGESTNLGKLLKLTPNIPAIDLFELFDEKRAGHPSFVHCLHQNDISLATGGSLENTFSQEIQSKIYESLALYETALAITWDSCLCSLLAIGIQKKLKLITQIIASYEGQRIRMGLHQHSEKIFCLSLLGIDNWMDQSESIDRLVYFPHHYPKECEERRDVDQERYVQDVAKLNGKEIAYGANTVVIGCVGRFLPVKNVDAAIEAIEEVHTRHPNILFVLKGRYDASWDVRDSEGYTPYLRRKIAKAFSKPWFLWDWRWTPQPKILDIYRSFDFSLNITGGDLASTTGIEQMAVGTPCIMLEGGSNDVLFKNAVLFVKNQGITRMRHSNCLYHMPDQHDLIEKIERFLTTERDEWAEKGLLHTRRCFSPKLALHKISLLLHDQDHKTLLAELREDYRRHDLEIPDLLC